MLAAELKKYLAAVVPDQANVLIFVKKTGEVRQLLMSDLDINHDGNIVIDAEYEVPAKMTAIVEDNAKHQWTPPLNINKKSAHSGVPLNALVSLIW